MKYEPVIGLEIHVQLATQSKMFCCCPNGNANSPNQNVCPVCLGLPGSLPTINNKAVDFAVMLGLATNSKICLNSEFARKNYFYPDLPKAYQISQFDKPICEQGWVEVDVNGTKRKIGITRIHMEEDAGKLIHDGPEIDCSYVDFNRAGVPLLEIVSEPVIKSSQEAKAYMETIYSIVTALGICQGDMEKGNLRCDANISIRPQGSNEFNTRTETKNLNSFRFVQQAIDYEIARQIDLTLDGQKIIQETRLFDSTKKKTFSMRKKEDAHDYRYFPCPDLPLAVLDEKHVQKLAQSLPELPEQRKQRYQTDFQLGEYDAGLLANNVALAKFFEQTVALKVDPKKVANWLLGEVSKILNEQGVPNIAATFQPKHLQALVRLVDDQVISLNIAKEIFPEIYQTGENPESLVKAKGLVQISDSNALEAMCQEILEKHPAEVKAYQEGKDRLLGFFVGQVMAKSKGKANPKMVSDLFLQLLQKKP